MKRKLPILLLALLALSSCEVIIFDDDPWVIIDDRDQFVGAYRVSEYSRTFDAYHDFVIDVVKDRGDNNVIYIRNFYGDGIEVFGNVNGERLVIPAQNVGPYIIQGTGSCFLGSFILDYTVEYNGPDTYFLDDLSANTNRL